MRPWLPDPPLTPPQSPAEPPAMPWRRILLDVAAALGGLVVTAVFVGGLVLFWQSGLEILMTP
jgi:hypothetical protein